MMKIWLLFLNKKTVPLELSQANCRFRVVFRLAHLTKKKKNYLVFSFSSAVHLMVSYVSCGPFFEKLLSVWFKSFIVVLNPSIAVCNNFFLILAQELQFWW